MEEQNTPQQPSQQPQPALVPASDPASTSVPAPASEEPKRILCIEDERFIAELYKRALEKLGYEVDVIPDGKLGMEAALTDRYDVILLDIMVPQVMGVDILPKLRERQPPLKAKIVVATNLEQDKESRAGMENVADGYIIKAEVTPHEVAEIVRSLV